MKYILLIFIWLFLIIVQILWIIPGVFFSFLDGDVEDVFWPLVQAVNLTDMMTTK